MGATPWGSIASGVAGLAQSIIGGINARKAQRKLERLQSPTYRQNQSILDYYNEALNRYNTAPTDSALYKRSIRDINSGVASGIGALQDRNSALAGIPSIIRASNDAKLNAEVAAEQLREQRFGQLGGATEMKAGEDKMAFDINEYQPFERKYNLLAAKAGGANQTTNAGLTNLFNSFQNFDIMRGLKDNSRSGGFWNTRYGKLYSGK